MLLYLTWQTILKFNSKVNTVNCVYVINLISFEKQFSSRKIVQGLKCFLYTQPKLIQFLDYINSPENCHECFLNLEPRERMP